MCSIDPSHLIVEHFLLTEHHFHFPPPPYIILSIALNQALNFVGRDSESGIQATLLIAGVNFNLWTEVNCA